MFKLTDDGIVIMTGSFDKCWQYMIKEYGHVRAALLIENEIFITRNV